MSIAVSNTQVNMIVNAAGVEPKAVYADYSGRAMYGAECLGFTGDDATEVTSIIIAVGEVLGTDVAKTARYDSMGLSQIVYFPTVTAPDWVDEDDEWMDDEDDDE